MRKRGSKIYIRVVCDHFGPWLNVLVAGLYLKEAGDKRQLVILAQEGSICRRYLSLIKKNINLQVISNPVDRAIISPMFFSISSYNCNGWVIKENSTDEYLNSLDRVPVLSDTLLEQINKHLILSSDNPPVEFETICNNRYVLYYARSGKNWKYSIGESQRNLHKDDSRMICKVLIGMGFNILVIGDTPQTYLPESENIMHIGSYDDLEGDLDVVYKNAEALIGSASGASHFPSVIYNIKTLYITEMEYQNLDDYYLPPVRALNADNNMLTKDYWLFLGERCVANIEKRNEFIRSALESFLTVGKNENQKDLFEHVYIYRERENKRVMKATANGNIALYKA